MLAAQVLQNEPRFHDLGEQTTRELVRETSLTTLVDNVEMFGLGGGDALFDRIFRQASATWVTAGYITKEVSPQQARDESFLKEFYTPEKGCREYETSLLPISFSPGKAELSSEAQKILDADKVFLQLTSQSGVRFCVEANADEGIDPQLSRKVSHEREEAIISYLKGRYNLLRDRFGSANGDACEANDGEKSMPCIRLKLVNTGGPR